jgi:hypothetical protein
MLELDDIQHLLLTRAPALTARYEFLSFRDGAGGRAWVSAIKEKVHSAASMRDGVDQDKRWVTAAHMGVFGSSGQVLRHIKKTPVAVSVSKV